MRARGRGSLLSLLKSTDWRGSGSIKSLVHAATGDIMDSRPSNGPQHVRALKRANEVRRARALIKRRIATGDLTAAQVILSHRWELATMQIAEVLLSQRRWGRTSCDRFLARLNMRENKRIGSMTERQRVAVAAILTADARAGPSDRGARAGLESDADAPP